MILFRFSIVALFAASILLATLFAILLMGAVSNVAAEERQRPLTAITVGPAPYSARPLTIPASVEIVEAATIAEQQPVGITQLAPLMPGVAKSSDSIWAGEVNIRGLSRDSVVMLIDGARINTANDIAARFGLVDPLEIERIEILKGPVTSQFGSGSLGGVVNIITRSGAFTEQPATDGALSLRARTNPEGGGAFGYARYGSPDWFLYASQSVRDFSSYDDGDGNSVRNSQFQDFQSKLKIGHKFNERHHLEGQIQVFEGRDIGIPGSGTAPLPAAADVTYPRTGRILTSLLHTYEPPSGEWKQSQLRLYYQGIDRRARIDAFPLESPVMEIKPEADHGTWGTKWQNDFVFGKHEFLSGIDVWYRTLSSDRERFLRNGAVLRDIPLPDSSYLSSGIFFEDTYRATEQFSVSFGARSDYIHVENDPTENWKEREVDEGSWNAHVGAEYALNDSWTTTIIGARGYRAATLAERYTFLQLGGGVVKFGDPELDPERSWFGELGLHFAKKPVTFRLAAFVNSLDDLIAERRVDEATIVNANIAEAEILGVEFDAEWAVSKMLTIYGNIAYAEGRDTANDEYLPQIAPLNGLGGLRLQDPSGLWFSVEAPFAAKQDKTPAGTEPVDGWITVDATAGYTFKAFEKNHSVYLIGRNIFDADYENYLTTSRGAPVKEPGWDIGVGYTVDL